MGLLSTGVQATNLLHVLMTVHFALKLCLEEMFKSIVSLDYVISWHETI